MSALSEQLTQHLDKLDSEGGLSTLHLLSLPNSINRVLRLFLKSKQVSYESLLKAIADTPHEDKMESDDLDLMLKLLCDREWLVRTEDQGTTFYGINLRPAVASASAKADQNETAKELWEKAEMDSAGTSQSSSQMHADITGKLKLDKVADSDLPPHERETKRFNSEEMQQRAEKYKADATTKNDTSASGDSKKDKTITADDLWDVLD